MVQKSTLYQIESKGIFMGWVKRKERLPKNKKPVLVKYSELGEYIK